MYTQTYKARTTGPIFYSSIEGELVKTDKFLSSTALTYAIGYSLEDLPKYYVTTGERAENPDYTVFESVPYFISDMIPIEVYTDERTFRSVAYTGECNITTESRDVAERMDTKSKYAFPKILNNSYSGWHRLRNFSGVGVDSTYKFTVWSEEKLPETLRFEMGINRTGYIIAEQIQEPESNQKVDLNEYILKEVYDISNEEISDIMEHGGKYYPGNDPRISRYAGININRATEIVKHNGLHKSEN